MPKPTVLARMIVFLSVLAIAEGKPPISDWGNVQMIASGTQIRVVAGKAKAVSGALVSVTDTTIMLLSVGAGQQPFDKAQVASVSVKKQGHRLRNTLIGLGVGFGIGLAIGGKYTDESRPASGGSFATLGAGVGALWRTGGWGKVYER